MHANATIQRVRVTGSQQKSILVAKELVNAIRSGAYPVGARLPSERELGALLGVSRASVREALSALHVAGVVVSVVGDGTYVQSHLTEGSIDSALSILELEGDLEDWLVAREEVETAVARMAVKRATAEDFARLDTALERMKVAQANFDIESYLEADAAFHQALFMASHNATLQRMTSMLLGSMRRQFWKNVKRTYFSRQRLLTSSYERHKSIVEALHARDAEGVERSTRFHFQVLYEGLGAG